MFRTLAAIAGGMMATFVVGYVDTEAAKYLYGAIMAGLLVTFFLGLDWLTHRPDVHGSPSANVGGSASQSVVVGRARDITYSAAPTERPVVTEGWQDQPGAPAFKLSQSGSRRQDGYRQEMGFYQHDGEPAGGIKARFPGAGVRMNMVPPKDTVLPRHYKMPSDVLFAGAGEADPELGAGVVGFEVQFNWEGGERHVLWVAPFAKDEERNRWDVGWKADPDRFWSVLP